MSKDEGYLVIRCRFDDTTAFKNDELVDALVAVMALAKIEFIDSNVYPIDSVVIDENAYL